MLTFIGVNEAIQHGQSTVHKYVYVTCYCACGLSSLNQKSKLNDKIVVSEAGLSSDIHNTPDTLLSYASRCYTYITCKDRTYHGCRGWRCIYRDHYNQECLKWNVYKYRL